MDKLKLHSPDLSQDNVAKIRDLFPGCVTEATDENGKARLAVDFDQLRQELSDHVVDGPQERYHLNWPGKREALALANAPIAKTLHPSREESADPETTRNLFVEGDNLEALKLLQKAYLGQVKFIYIDPPYNTGNDFVYEDDFVDSSADFLLKSNEMSDSGDRLVANTTANGRFHSDWQSFLYPRLKLARDFLSEDGAIFISIDDGEYSSLKIMCDEIFGGENFVANLIWKSRQIIDSRNKTKTSTDHEYILVYTKSKESFALRGKEIEDSKYSNPDNDPRGPWMSNSILGLANATQRPNLHYSIVDPDTSREFACPPDTGWRYSKETMAEKIADARIIFPRSDDGRPREKKFRSELTSEFTGFSSILSQEAGYTLNGSREVRDLFGAKFFDFPKPVSLLDILLQQGAPNGDELVMDFFAGSGTTAHAVMAANAKDGGCRSFILVQLPEALSSNSEAYKSGYKTIADLSKERIRRAGKKILEGDCHPDWNKDVGFRVLKIDTSNMQDVYYRPDQVEQKDLLDAVDNIKPDRTPEDLLFQVMVDWGSDLAAPISRETVLGKTVFFVNKSPYAGPDLIACFDTGVTEDLVKELAKHEPVKAVFRDNGFISDAVKINVEQIFRQLSPTTDVKSI
ncbi:MAG: site-specific DNA-methyltransferase [Hyphomicrobiales bacterium]